MSYSARVHVTLTVEIDCGSWHETAPLAEVERQATDTAFRTVDRYLKPEIPRSLKVARVIIEKVR